jgi:hypothetical protein
MTDESERILKKDVVALYPGISLEGLRKTAEELSHDRQCPGRDSNRVVPE